MTASGDGSVPASPDRANRAVASTSGSRSAHQTVCSTRKAIAICLGGLWGDVQRGGAGRPGIQQHGLANHVSDLGGCVTTVERRLQQVVRGERLSFPTGADGCGELADDEHPHPAGQRAVPGEAAIAAVLQ